MLPQCCRVPLRTRRSLDARDVRSIPGTRRFHASDNAGNRLEFMAPSDA
jgi:hypothetical protein